MTISDFDAQFRSSENILKHERVFVSHDMPKPLTRDPLKEYGGDEPIPYGMLLLTNERILFLFDPTPAIEYNNQSKMKSIATGVAKGVARRYASKRTEGTSDWIEKLAKWELGKLDKDSINFSLYKDAKSSISIPLNQVKGYTMSYKNWSKIMALVYPFQKSYLTLHYQDERGMDHWICIYSNTIGETEPLNPKKWLKSIKKVNRIPELHSKQVVQLEQLIASQRPIPIQNSQAVMTPQEGMITCPNCGTAQFPGKFCGTCGVPLPEQSQITPQASETVPIGMIKCSNCGKVQNLVNFCGSCGSNLGEEPARIEINQDKPIICWNCGIPQSPGKFCGTCGVLFSDAPNSYVGSTSGLSASAEKAPELLYNRTTRLERFTKVLFSENVRKDILKSNYNIEAGLTWIVFILFWDTIVSNKLSSYEGIDFGSFFQFFFYRSAILIVVQLVLILLLTFILGLILRSGITFPEIFRIYTYTFVIPLILAAIFSEFILPFFFIYTGFYSLFDGYANLLLTFVEVLIMAIGYKTLFKTGYLKAFILLAIVIVISSIPLLFLGIFLFF